MWITKIALVMIFLISALLYPSNVDGGKGGKGGKGKGKGSGGKMKVIMMGKLSWTSNSEFFSHFDQVQIVS